MITIEAIVPLAMSCLLSYKITAFTFKLSSWKKFPANSSNMAFNILQCSFVFLATFVTIGMAGGSVRLMGINTMMGKSSLYILEVS